MPQNHIDFELEPVASPCINVCTLDAARTLCTGCYRTLAEISAWSRVDIAQQREILAASAQRRQQLEKGR